VTIDDNIVTLDIAVAASLRIESVSDVPTLQRMLKAAWRGSVRATERLKKARAQRNVARARLKEIEVEALNVHDGITYGALGKHPDPCSCSLHALLRLCTRKESP
jgi:hypothetical protein